MRKEIAEKLAKKINPKEIHLQESKIMGHPVIEVVPLFGNEKERHPASEEELKNLQEEILKPEEIEAPKEEPIIPEEELSAPLYKLPPRIP